MASYSTPNSFTTATTIFAEDHNDNFQAVSAAITDGTIDYNINDLTVNGDAKGMRGAVLQYSYIQTGGTLPVTTFLVYHGRAYRDSVAAPPGVNSNQYVMHRSGSVMGWSVNIYAKPFALNTTYTVDVRPKISQSAIATFTFNVGGGSAFNYASHATAARGSHTFSPGSTIQLECANIVNSGVTAWEGIDIMGCIEVVFDD